MHLEDETLGSVSSMLTVYLSHFYSTYFILLDANVISIIQTLMETIYFSIITIFFMLFNITLLIFFILNGLVAATTVLPVLPGMNVYTNIQ